MGLIVIMCIRLHSTFRTFCGARLYTDLQKDFGTKDIDAYLTKSEVGA